MDSYEVMDELETALKNLYQVIGEIKALSDEFVDREPNLEKITSLNKLSAKASDLIATICEDNLF
jgi:hypothetical protein